MSAIVPVSYAAAQFAQGLGVSSISSNGLCAPDAHLGREIFGARLATRTPSLSFVRLRMQLASRTRLCRFDVAGASPSFIGVHVLRWRDSKPFSMNLFILFVI